MSRPFALAAYGAAMGALTPLAPLLLRLRAARGKEEAGRRGERLGRASMARPEGALVWLHGASVGETRVNLALAGALAAARPELGFLITTHTRTAAGIAADALPPRGVHQYAPLDAPGAARRFLDHWRPDLAVFAESEIWPGLILEISARSIPLALANARMSARSLSRWGRRAPRSIGFLLSRFDWIGAADAATARGLAALSGREVALAGNVKLDAPAQAPHPARLAELRAAIGARPVWCAASTHKGEEAIVLEAHAALRHGAPDALLILVPRHPERGDEVEAAIRAAGLSCARRSHREFPAPDTDVYLADTLGETALFYTLSPAVLLGGSLVPGVGGHNPAEPARAGAALLTGPHMDSFADLFLALEAGGGARIVDGAMALSLALAGLVVDPRARARANAAAQSVLEGSRGALDRSAEALLALLDGREGAA